HFRKLLKPELNSNRCFAGIKKTMITDGKTYLQLYRKKHRIELNEKQNMRYIHHPRQMPINNEFLPKIKQKMECIHCGKIILIKCRGQHYRTRFHTNSLIIPQAPPLPIIYKPQADAYGRTCTPACLRP
ncbi:hypothetical protein LCGC14_1984440, partial [marine sediment metagenome]